MLPRLAEDSSDVEPINPMPLPGGGGGGGGGRVGGVPGAPWQAELPESVNVCPATGVNSQV